MPGYILNPFGDDPEPYFSKRGLIRMLVPDDYLRCAVFVGAYDGGKFTPRATAFIVSFEQDGYNFQHVVTAEHVVSWMLQQNEDMYLRVRFSNGFSGEMPLPPSLWHFHPDERKITDVAVCPLHTTWISKEDGHKVKVDQLAVPLSGDESMSPEFPLSQDKVKVGAEICIIGLFVSHYGREHNTPIVRIGNISMLKGDPIKTRYKGYMDGYLIEARSIGGLSGSPVFFSVPDEQKFWIRKFYLLGLVHGHFDIPDLTSDTVTDDMQGSGINAGIGVVVPASDIIETLCHPDLVAQRKEAAMKLNQENGVTPDLAGANAPVAESATKPAENPAHREDFTALVGAASKPKPKDDRT